MKLGLFVKDFKFMWIINILSETYFTFREHLLYNSFALIGTSNFQDKQYNRTIEYPVPKAPTYCGVWQFLGSNSLALNANRLIRT
jgi:hypothetical protein